MAVLKRTTGKAAAEIEEGLLEAREAERLGVTPKTASDALFFTDNTGDASLASKIPPTKSAPAICQLGEQEDEWELGELEIDRRVRPHSSLSIQPARIRSERAKSGELALLKKLAKNAPAKTAMKKAALAPCLDAWRDEFPQEKIGFPAKISSSTLVSLPDPVLESYNPEMTALNEKLTLLESTLKAEKSIKKAIIKGVEENDKDMIERANQELLKDSPDVSESEPDVNFCSHSEKKHITGKKKTLAQRARQERHTAAVKAVQEAKRQRALLASIDKLTQKEPSQDAKTPFLEIRNESKDSSRLMRKKKVAGRPLLTSVLPAFKLPEEQPASLRLLSAEGDPVLEKYRAFAMRGMIEPTGPLLPAAIRTRLRRRNSRKGKLKYYLQKSSASPATI